MPLTTVPLANRMHAAIGQIQLTEPESLLKEGRVIPFLSRLTRCASGGQCAWELVFSSVARSGGTALEARLIVHASLPAPQRPLLPGILQETTGRLLHALKENGLAAREAEGSLPGLNGPFLALYHRGNGFLSEEAELTEGHLRQRLCAEAGNGLSLLLVSSAWEKGELEASGLTEARRALLAREVVFRFAVTLWGPQAQANAAWLQELTLSWLTPFTPGNARLYPLCLRRDPWHLLTLLPKDASQLALSELLTLCGCPAEPGEMQRMCRSTWRETASEALERADIALLPADLTLQKSDLHYLGLRDDGDLEALLQMTPQMAEMLRMCVAILRQLGLVQRPGESKADTPGNAQLAGYLLPTAGHIYEQFVRECCYDTVYAPYYAYATGRRAYPVTRVFLATYDQGPGCKGYRLQSFSPDATEPAMQSMIRERMIDDFAAYAALDGQLRSDAWWRHLFNDMATARSQRNYLAHEQSDLLAAERFARAFLLEQPGCPSLLRRLLDLKRIETVFPPFSAEKAVPIRVMSM